mmetsp:Transcript_15302/g.45321  ORF Transcript_15302/g.45321 Transcript_15302/m.45321 type:complete len:213 (-) Transcript_15302:264-902(-)
MGIPRRQLAACRSSRNDSRNSKLCPMPSLAHPCSRVKAWRMRWVSWTRRASYPCTTSSHPNWYSSLATASTVLPPRRHWTSCMPWWALWTLHCSVQQWERGRTSWAPRCPCYRQTSCWKGTVLLGPRTATLFPLSSPQRHWCSSSSAWRHCSCPIEERPSLHLLLAQPHPFPSWTRKLWRRCDSPLRLVRVMHSLQKTGSATKRHLEPWMLS